MIWKKKVEVDDQAVSLDIDKPVWFFLIEVCVTGDTEQPWIKGSTALVQVFVPGSKLEECLERLDAFLPSQELERIDTLRVRYNPNEDDPDIPSEYFRDTLEQAGRTNEPAIGIFVVSQETAWRRNDVT